MSDHVDETDSVAPMHVEQGSTPDGRLLLYFTFGSPSSPSDAKQETSSSRDEQCEESKDGRAT
jgi:hypothetical protein